MSRGPERGVQRVVPVAFGIAGLLLAVVLLPTILRPPPPEQNSSAEFAPDAPPDEDVEAIISSLQRAGSRTAGGDGDSGGGGGGAPSAPPTTVERRTRACPRGVGDPPRQWGSTYAPPCAGVWQGDNGRATAPGVTGDTIRLVSMFQHGATAGSHNSFDSPGNRRVCRGCGEDTEYGAQERTTIVHMEFLNQAFQTYGRTVELYWAQPPGDGTQNAGWVDAIWDELGGFFGVVSEREVILERAAERGAIAIGMRNPPSRLFHDHPRHVYSWDAGGDDLLALNTSYICRRLAGRTAAYAGDPTYQAKIRRFGIVVTKGSHGLGDYHRGNDLEGLKGALEDRCPERLTESIVQFTFDNSNSNEMSTAIARFKLDGVTSVVLVTDPMSPATLTTAADSAGYNPEWVLTGHMEMDNELHPTFLSYSKNQWSRAFGLAPDEWFRYLAQMDFERAYKMIDPDNTAHTAVGLRVFPTLHQFLGGIQAAGPVLNAETFQRGLWRLGEFRRSQPINTWSMCCGFAPGDNSYASTAREIYYTARVRPDNFNAGLSQGGAYLKVDCGKRYGAGDFDDRAPDYFRHLPTDCKNPPDADAW